MAATAVLGMLIVAGGGVYLIVRDGRSNAPDRSGAAPTPTGAPVQTVRITSTESGYEPDRISVRAGSLVRLTFVRTTDKTCGTEVIFPSLNINRPLPLNEPVVIEFTPAKTGELAFACGKNMLTGVVVVQ